MKQLLLTQRILEHDAYPETREALDIRWGSFVRACGFLPVPLACTSNPEEYVSAGGVAGLILTGGNDLASIEASPENVLRDEIDGRALLAALANNLPVLGVCRGMQFLLSHFGSELHKTEGHVGKRHSLVLTSAGTIFDDLRLPPEVNSFHNFAALDAPKGFQVVARSDDGMLEAVVEKKKGLIGIMWHPEREEPQSNSDIELAKRLFGGSL